VASGLPAEKAAYQVVCSVCGGMGKVQPRDATTTRNLFLRIILPVVASSLVLMVIGFGFGYHYSSPSEARRMEEFFEAVARRRRTLPVLTVRMMVRPGQTMKDVELVLGRPERRTLPPSGSISEEQSDYKCMDGVVKVIYQNGKVQSVTEGPDE
jgi:hypothetical protein